jgi:iron-sulfur cluster repair protein YtfE (RIC family)
VETIVEFMSNDHKSCDNQFALAEEAAHAGQWQEAEAAFMAFNQHMTQHFLTEEEHLFPALLAAGGPNGPVQVMHMEHAQMNSLLGQMTPMVANKNLQGYSGLAETLLILMQQHNLKEEQILYPIAQRLLADKWEGLRRQILSSQQPSVTTD